MKQEGKTRIKTNSPDKMREVKGNRLIFDITYKTKAEMYRSKKKKSK